MDEEKAAESTSESREGQLPAAPPYTHSSELNAQGWRRIVLLASVFVGLFLSFLDTTIVSVALTTIATRFDDFNHSTWVITAYLLTYMAFAIIISRFSDIFGLKVVEVTSFIIFIAFSLGCALSQSMTQLIIFRSLQGIGASGLFSMTMVIAIHAVRPERRAMVSATIGIVMVTSGVLGPLLSGAIAHNRHASTWRWIFYLNLPVGGLALLALLISWPKGSSQKKLTRKAFLSVDYLGCLLLLVAAVLLIFALEEGGAFILAWDSAAIIASLVLSGVAFVAFIVWQQWLAAHPTLPVKLIFPVKVLKQRVMAATIVATLLAGFDFYIAVINIPQRFQIVDQDSPVMAGVKLLPMMASSAAGSFTAGILSSKRNRTALTLILAGVFQVLGYGLMITLGDGHPTSRNIYGFEVFLGLGFGLAVASVTITAQLEVEPEWIAVTQGTLTQMRSLGGSIGLAISVIIFNGELRDSSALASVLTPSQRKALFKSPLALESFRPAQQELVAQVYAKAFTQEMQVATYIAAAFFLISLLTIQRKPPHPLVKSPQSPPPAATDSAAETGSTTAVKT